MRKGSTKKLIVNEHGDAIQDQNPDNPFVIGEIDSEHERFPRKVNPKIVDILLRLCDACHEMDTRTEPWASIRKDIERLK